ncbi:ribonuclease III [bacterium]|nr:ribonuclease III [bacterium]
MSESASPITEVAALAAARQGYQLPCDTLTLLSEDDVSDLEQALGHSFQNRQLLEHALTHASVARTRLESNERLEFLGDAIMGVVVCEFLFHSFPEYSEGELTRIKSAVVSRHTCTKLSNKLGLGQFLLLGKGLAMHERIPGSVLAAVFESIVAGIFLDGGWAAAEKFVLEMLGDEIARIAKTSHGQNFKSQLQQVAQKEFGETPQYKVLDEKGPDHSKCFEIAAAIGTKMYPSAWGPSKKEAEQSAAKNAIDAIEVAEQG